MVDIVEEGFCFGTKDSHDEVRRVGRSEEGVCCVRVQSVDSDQVDVMEGRCRRIRAVDRSATQAAGQCKIISLSSQKGYRLMWRFNAGYY
jgi:hypothetical protein